MTTAAARSTDQPVERSADSDQPVGGIFPRLMAAARNWWPSKTAVELAAILGCEVRSAERYLAGDRTPAADAVIALIRSEHGVKVLALVVADMPPRRAADFWKEMAKAARRAEILEERARLERELSQVGG